MYVHVLWTYINLINDSSLLQERLKEIPTSVSTSSDGNFLAGFQEPLVSLPGSEFEQPLHPNIQVNIYVYIDTCGLRRDPPANALLTCNTTFSGFPVPSRVPFCRSE